MSVLPLDPWVLKTRKTILWIGFSWPVLVVVLSSLLGKRGGGEWAIIGTLFLATLFAPLSLVLSLILPTYKSRIIVVPPVCLFVLLIVSGFRAPPLMLLWITSFTAIGLLIPQWSSMRAFFRRRFP
jgi:hypothetical protein